jgi:hypothetical protein
MSVSAKQATKVAQNMFMMLCDGRGTEKACYPIGYLAEGSGKEDAEMEMKLLKRHYSTYVRNERLTTLLEVMGLVGKVEVIVLWNDSMHERYWTP